jgi:hypothetical protein
MGQRRDEARTLLSLTSPTNWMDDWLALIIIPKRRIALNPKLWCKDGHFTREPRPVLADAKKCNGRVPGVFESNVLKPTKA